MVLDTYFEADVYFKKQGLLKFYFSNDFDLILNAYIRQTKTRVCLENEIEWDLGKKISKKISSIMTRYNVNYSMTFYIKGEYRIINFYKRIGENFYFDSYRVKPSKKEVTAYYKRKYPFYYYYGYISGLFHRLFNRNTI